jgi:hypothetical protein
MRKSNVIAMKRIERSETNPLAKLRRLSLDERRFWNHKYRFSLRVLRLGEAEARRWADSALAIDKEFEAEFNLLRHT